jgi:hypothetical protein
VLRSFGLPLGEIAQLLAAVEQRRREMLPDGVA